MKYPDYAGLIFPFFAQAVLDRTPKTYGYFARKAGRNSATDSMVIGPAMHQIGACCVLLKLPIAPLHYVGREDGTDPDVFQNEDLEKKHILPHYDMLRVLAREHRFTQDEMSRLEIVVKNAQRHEPVRRIGPHGLWKHVIENRREGCSQTLWVEALHAYRSEFDDLKERRNNPLA